MFNQRHVNNEIIYRNDVFLIIAMEGTKKIPVDADRLKWNQTDEIEPNLTLKEISDQLKALGYKGVFYVWYEWDLTGRIYQYGNYKPYDFWVEHGTTKGYA